MRRRNGSRTIWTGEMDRYLVGLLMEQMKKGNFSDHVFGKQAWKSVATLFNSNFKFNYEKDIFKNRYKVLRILYRNVKRLLDRPGFSWDYSRNMISADIKVWEEHLKVHRDARAFRMRTIPYYRELCVIYGDLKVEETGDDGDKLLHDEGDSETAEAAWEKSKSEGALDETGIHDLAVDNKDSTTISFSRGSVDSERPDVTPDWLGGYRPRLYWQPPMDRYFINLMLEELEKGNQRDSVFRKQSWRDMVASFNSKFGYNCDVDVLKNRFKTLKKQHNAILNLLEHDRFCWDDTRQMVTGDDSVWQDYIKKHTDARQYMSRPVPYYKELCRIFGDHEVDETDCLFPPRLELQNGVPVKVHGLSRSCSSPGVSVSSEDEVGGSLELASAGAKSVISNGRSKLKVEIPPVLVSTKGSCGKEHGIISSFHPEMTTGVPSLSCEMKDEALNDTSTENIVKAVQALPNMDDDLILDACDFLEDETKAKTFMALNVKLRKKWLLRKLRP